MINKKAMINDDDNQTDHHNRIAMFCRFGIRLPPAASAQCAFAVCSSFLIDAATTGMMVMMVMMNTILMVVRAARIVAALQPGCEEMERE